MRKEDKKKMYEGKRVRVKHPLSGRIMQGIVAGAHPEKGITIVKEEDPEKICYCALLDNPDQNEWEYFTTVMSSGDNPLYDEIAYLIEIGYFTEDEVRIMKIGGSMGIYKCSSQDKLQQRCAFSQKGNN